MLPANLHMGVGTWAWGDRLVWKYGIGYNEEDLRKVFKRALLDGVNFFACSETFAEGKAEKFLGKFTAETEEEVFLSTKFCPRPWRLRRADFMKALKRSLLRLNRNSIELYEVMAPEGRSDLQTWAECAAEAMDLGLVKQVGMSNFNAAQIDVFNEYLSRFGYAPACLETEYNLLVRDIETNGVLDICRKLHISIAAQNPLAMGYLSGKMDLQHPSSDNRRSLMMKYCLPSMDLLFRTMNHIGMENNGMNCAQVALNWLLCKGVIPIPGAKTIDRVIENDRALSFRMTNEQLHLLDSASDKVLSNYGNIQKETGTNHAP